MEGKSKCFVLWFYPLHHYDGSGNYHGERNYNNYQVPNNGGNHGHNEEHHEH